VLELKARGYKGAIIHNQGIANPDFLRVAGKAADGMILAASPVTVAEQLPATAAVKQPAMEYVKLYEGKYGPNSRSLFGATAWDGYLLFAQALPIALKAGQPGTPAFRTALRERDGTGEGPLRRLRGLFDVADQPQRHRRTRAGAHHGAGRQLEAGAVTPARFEKESIVRHLWLAVALLVMSATLPAPSAAQTLRIALNQEPDVLDPTSAAASSPPMCSRDVRQAVRSRREPQHRADARHRLSLRGSDTSGPHPAAGISFHNGEKLDAEAVAYTFNRNLTAKGSRRALGLAALGSVEVVDPLTIRLVLKAPNAAFLNRLADFVGIVFAPKAAEADGDKFGLHPVCAGPFAFESRVAQDRIVLRRFPGHWNAGAYHFDEVTYQPMTDPHARIANLQTGAIDLIGFVPPSDIPTVKKDARLKIGIGRQMAYTGIIFNVGRGPAGQLPAGQNALVRQAFDAALDRKALSDVAFDGMFPPTIQPGFQGSPYYIASQPPPPRDLARAKACCSRRGCRYR